MSELTQPQEYNISMSDQEADLSEKVIIHGDPGTGKTLASGQLAKYYNVLYINLEKGMSTLKQLPKELKDHIIPLTIPDTPTWPIAVETMLKLLRGKPVKICTAHGKVDCGICTKESKPYILVELDKLDNSWVVVIDSLTQLTASATSSITKNVADPIEYKMQIDDWGNLSKICGMIKSYLQQAKYNLVCITHTIEAEMEDGSKKLVPLFGSKATSITIASAFNHVLYATIKNGKHILASSTTYRPNVLTKSASNLALENSTNGLLDIFLSRDTAKRDSTKGYVTGGIYTGLGTGAARVPTGNSAIKPSTINNSNTAISTCNLPATANPLVDKPAQILTGQSGQTKELTQRTDLPNTQITGSQLNITAEPNRVSKPDGTKLTVLGTVESGINDASSTSSLSSQNVREPTQDKQTTVQEQEVVVPSPQPKLSTSELMARVRLLNATTRK